MVPPYVGITRIRFMGSSAGPVRAPGSSQRFSAPPKLDVLLDAKRTSAAAASGGVRVVELEAGSVQSIDVVHLGSIHVEQAGFVDKNLQTFELENGITLIVECLVKSHSIGKAGAEI